MSDFEGVARFGKEHLGWRDDNTEDAPTDHKTLMLEALEDASHAASFDGRNSFTATAQVHATALVAEQARLANLITLESMSMARYDRLVLNTNVTAIRERLVNP